MSSSGIPPLLFNLCPLINHSLISPQKVRLQFAKPRVHRILALTCRDESLSAGIREAMAQEKTASFADPLRQVARTINLDQFEPDAPWGLVVYRTAYGDDVA